MQKILRRRILRDLRKNTLRYLALGLLIVLGMYLVVSLVGAADTVIIRVNEKAEENKVEDGEFSVFIPLSKDQEEKIVDKGITLESMFYLDFELADTSTIRVYENRQQINRINLDKGRIADRYGEAVIEKRYSEENGLSVGDHIIIGNDTIEIVGIGTVPDYDAMHKELSDSSVDSKQFGLFFVNEEQYNILKKSALSTKSEQYTYGYRLNDKMTDEELKEMLSNFQFSADEIEDIYFQEYWAETGGKKDDIQEGIRELVNGSQNLKDALNKLDQNTVKLNDGTNQILVAYLDEANEGLAEYGFKQELTSNNYETVLNSYIEKTENELVRLKLSTILGELNSLNDYASGVYKYTQGVADTAEGADDLAEGMEELEENTDSLLEEFFEVDMDNLTSFLPASENTRIKASSEDRVINKFAGLIAGVIVMILFTYVISVFVMHGIEKESSVIGAIYALGVKKKDLIIHYLTLPVIITFLAGIVGTTLGFSKYGLDLQLKDCYDYFSVPKLQVVYPVYLILYGTVMPPIVGVIINCFVINNKLSQPALKLINNDQKTSKISNVNLGNMGFVGRFRIRQMLREGRTGITVVLGMFIALLIMMLGIDCYVLCNNLSIENKKDTRYQYMYTYKYPEKEVPTAGEACFAKGLYKEIYGYNLEVTLLGIDKENPYFDAEVTKGQNQIILSTAAAQKYHLKVGDKMILTDKEMNLDYAFTIKGIAQYSVGLYAFMDIESMRELFGVDEEYYNVVLSDHSLDIEAGRLYAVTTKADISKGSDVFIRQMMPMIIMLVSASAIIFCVVMYLMMKVMIDRSAFGISLIKIFGYRTKEIKKLYINGNFYTIAIGAAICIQLSKNVIDKLFPILISNVGVGMNITFSWQLYLGIYFAVIILYLVINQLLVGRLNKMTPTEVLKNRE